MSTPAEGVVHLDTGDLEPPERAVVNYVLQAREYLQLARETVMDNAADQDITTDTAQYTAHVIDALDGILLDDLATIAGLDLPPGSHVDDAYDTGNG